MASVQTCTALTVAQKQLKMDVSFYNTRRRQLFLVLVQLECHSMYLIPIVLLPVELRDLCAWFLAFFLDAFSLFSRLAQCFEFPTTTSCADEFLYRGKNFFLSFPCFSSELVSGDTISHEYGWHDLCALWWQSATSCHFHIDIHFNHQASY